MNIEKVEENTKCNWCRDGAQLSPPAYYHLRCAGKLMVLRIEGILPDKAFSAVVKELNTNIVDQSLEEEE